jgi:thymidylate synthase
MEKKNNLDPQYNKLLEDILENGTKKQTRNGEVISVFGRQIRHNMGDGFPLLTGKKMFWKGIVTELIWFLRGDTNIKYLVDNNCHIWDGDAYKAFEKWKQETDAKIRRENPTIDFQPLKYESEEEFINKIKTDADFAEKWGDLGPVYGKQWRSWKSFEHEYGEDDNGDGFIGMWKGKEKIDQIENLINDLKTNPDSRRLMVNAWNVGELDQMVLPPCHYGFQVYTRELSWEERRDLLTKEQFRDEFGYLSPFTEPIINYYLNSKNIPKRAISLMWNQRSVDTFLGLPFNIASYGLLLEIIAKEVNMIPDELIGNLGDTHLYLNHVEQAKEQIGRELSLEERIELAKGKVVPLLGSKEDSYNEAGIPTRTREPYPLPKLVINDEFWNPDADLLSNLPHIQVSDFYVDNYQSHPTIKAPLSN